MVKLVLSFAVLLVVCQMASAYSVPENQQIELRRPNEDCAREMADTAREFLAPYIARARALVNNLLEQRRACEGLGGASGTICWTRYRANVLFAIIDVIEQIRLLRENSDTYALGLLESYYECREALDNIDEFEAIFEEVATELRSIAALSVDIECAIELRDNIEEIAQQFIGEVRERILAARVIRRECQALEAGIAETRCWWRFRLEVLYGVVDTLRDIELRRSRFNATVLELLESYYVCRDV